MRAIGFSKYGAPEVLEIYDLPEVHAGRGEPKTLLANLLS